MINRGKEFEQHFMKDWKKSFPNSFIFRLKDDVSQYKYTAKNPCDFICYAHRTLFLIETKSVHGNTFPFSNLSQYDKLLSYSSVEDLVAGVIIWYVDRDVVLFVPITEIREMKKDKLKSVNVKTVLDSKYKVIKIPSAKKRVFMDSDYTVLADIGNNSEVEHGDRHDKT